GSAPQDGDLEAIRARALASMKESQGGRVRTAGKLIENTHPMEFRVDTCAAGDEPAAVHAMHAVPATAHSSHLPCLQAMKPRPAKCLTYQPQRRNRRSSKKRKGQGGPERQLMLQKAAAQQPSRTAQRLQLRLGLRSEAVRCCGCRGAEEQRRGMLVAVTTHEARERLSRIALVKPDKARAIENMILGAAQRGQLSEKVSEQRLVSMLEQISEKQGGGPKITIQRRRFDDD
ncbi:hypothetical protein QJQ45_028704, partial [Haematococcus lacustris]